MQRLKESLEVRNNQMLQQAHDRVHAAEEHSTGLEATISQLQATLSDLEAKDRSRTQLQQQAVAAALGQQQEHIERDAAHHRALVDSERARLQEDAQAQIQNAHTQHQVSNVD